MSYQVLARKWRPKNFPEMVGQDHVLRALINALDNDRLHHAFLFTGTRGVGKTTVARILAKSLNCLEGVSSKPCGVCSACTDIDDGRFVDLIEVDAASRTKVEDTRELLENVQYAPTIGRYKVYLIDEVHMLSTHSFNALLKTLEEPPSHVKFLLATTDPQKLPVTVLSRCLQFNMKSMSAEEIIGHLTNILAKEGIEYDEPSLSLLARSAEGSMRDALSLLDQAIAFGGGSLQEEDVRSMLGTIDIQHISNIIAAIAQNDAEGLIDIVRDIAQYSPDYSDMLSEIVNMLHRIALAQIVPSAIDNSLGDKDIVLKLANEITPEDAQLFYQIALVGRKDLPYVADQSVGFEMILLRMLAFKPVQNGQLQIQAPQQQQNRQLPQNKQPQSQTPNRQQSAPPDYLEGQEQKTGIEAARAALKKNSKIDPASAIKPTPVKKEPSIQPPSAAVNNPPQTLSQTQVQPITETSPVTNNEVAAEEKRSVEIAEITAENWSQVINKLQLSGMAYQLAANSIFVERNDKEHKFIIEASFSNLLLPALKEKLLDALKQFLRKDITIKIEIGSVGESGCDTPAQVAAKDKAQLQKNVEERIKQDPFVNSMREVFHAEIQPGSIVPV